MIMNKEINKEILFKYFSGMTTPLENRRIEYWLEKGNNEEVFYLYLDEWERANAQYIPDRERVFLSFKNKLNFEDGKNRKVNFWSLNSQSMNKWRWAIAVSVAFVVVVFFLLKDHILYKNYSTEFGETMTLILDDNSQVVLNADTQLKVPRWINYSRDREVWMTGEAFFNVSKKENHRKFLVHTDQLSVEVIGTRFNVTDRHNATKVVLQEGKVRVVANNTDREEAMLDKSGDYAEVNKENDKIITKTVDESLYTIWQEKRLKFENTPLPDVIRTIEDYYGIRVVASDTSLTRRNFSGTLPNNDLQVILEALSNIYSSEFKGEAR